MELQQFLRNVSYLSTDYTTGSFITTAARTTNPTTYCGM
jgi:hypothetical protein